MSFAVAVSAAFNPAATASLNRGCDARGSPLHRAAFVGTHFDDTPRRHQRQRRRAARVGTGRRDASGGVKWPDSTSGSHRRISCAAATGPGRVGRVLPPKTRAEGGAQDIMALFASFFNGGGGGGEKNEARRAAAKEALLDAIAGTARGVTATEEDVAAVDAAARDLERLNPNPRALKCDLLNGEWELLYTTSASILGATRPWPFRPLGGAHSLIHPPLKIAFMSCIRSTAVLFSRFHSTACARIIVNHARDTLCTSSVHRGVFVDGARGERRTKH